MDPNVFDVHKFKEKKRAYKNEICLGLSSSF